MKIQDFNYLIPIEINKKNFIYFYLPYLLLLVWLLLSFMSIFSIGLKNILNPFTLFSILVRISVVLYGLFFIKNIFIDRKNNIKLYNYFKIFIGYGIVITYIFYSFPRIVGEFYKNVSINYSIFNYILIIFIAMFPAAIYFIIKSDQFKLITDFYSQKDIDFEKKIKKDKRLKKKENAKLKQERSFLENLWYEWIDVIIQAIIIAMIIQQLFFQLYQIPSESMVNTFLIQDRVVGNKLIYGPHIPLTEWKFPSLIKPKVGDIVIFENPLIDDPKSDIAYNNVFSRIFHPFIYLATLSLIDIDKKKDEFGNLKQKERLLVKRLIAKEGEKICIVNDKVYKKTSFTQWELMSNIKNQKEYGQVDLNKDDTPGLRTQLITKEMREIYNEAEKLVDSYNIETIKYELRNEKQKFLSLISYSNYFNISIVDKDYQKYFSQNQIISDISGKDFLNQYHYSIYHSKIFKLLNLFVKQKKIDFYRINLYDDLKINPDDSPYVIYMKKVNAINKIWLLKLYNFVLRKDNYLFKPFKDINLIFKEDLYGILHNVYLLDIYIFDFHFDPKNEKLTSRYFSARQFSDFPSNKDEYINKNEYFMMGDNRYNSLDSRFTDDNNYYIDILLDPDDNTEFGLKTQVSWKPHTIKMKYVLGKAAIIYWPLERAKILK